MVQPIIVRFRDYSDRECVGKNMRVIPKTSNFSLNEDFPKSIVYNKQKTCYQYSPKQGGYWGKRTFHSPRIYLLFLVNIIQLNL